MDDRVNLLDLSVSELQELMARIGQESFRGKQIFRWLSKGVKDLDEMTDISKSLRDELKKTAFIGCLKIRKKLISGVDGTIKFLFELDDGNIIESVLMEYKHGYTVCISSQVGCRMGCRFCASSKAGFVRGLSSGEMLDQVISIQKDTGKRISNIVVMGIGEPLDNYDNLIKFVKMVNSPEGLNIGYRHITVSTCGLVPGIYKLSKEGLPINLSVSLHAPNDQIRDRFIPLNKKYSIDKIIEACKIYTEVTKRRITFEYAMIEGENDSKENAIELAQKIKGMLCHVNLIPLNQVKGIDYKQSGRQKINLFKEILERYNISTTVRRELGTDINAACGQLRRSEEKGM